MVRSRLLSPLATLGVALAASCLDAGARRPLGEACLADGDCEPGLVCLHGRCRAACAFDRDCPEGAACVSDPADPTRRACTLSGEGCGPDAACPGDLVCVEGLCRDPCGEVDCGPGRVCVDGACRDEPAGGDADADTDADADADADADRALYRPELTGDGYEDLVVLASATPYGELHVFAGGPGFAPDGPDAAFATIESAGPCALAGPLLLVDLDRDGASDLLAAERCDDAARLLFLPGPFAAGRQDLDDLAERTVLPPDVLVPPTYLAVADLDGDGALDLAASYQYGLAGERPALTPGEVHLYSDLASLPDRRLEAPDGSIVGTQVDDRLGTMGSAPGDVTGDGVADLLVGSPDFDEPGGGYQHGRVFLFAGPIEGLGLVAPDVAFSTYRAVDTAGHAGSGVALLDVSGDGLLDLVIGIDEYGGSRRGAVFAVLGPAERGEVLTAEVAWALLPGDPGDELGSRLEAHLDLDGDGALDLLVHSASGAQPVRGYLSPWDFESEPAPFFRLAPASQETPARAAAAGDLDGRGLDDLAFALPEAETGRGAVHVFFGEDGIPSGIIEDVSSHVIVGAPASGLGRAVLSL